MIDLKPTVDQEEVANSVTEFLRSELPVTRLRPGPQGGPGHIEKWSQFAELGFLGIGLDEASGGVGYSVIEEALVFREFGRYLISPHALGAVIGARVAARAGDSDLTEAILNGQAKVGVLLASRGPDGAALLGGEVHLVEAATSDWFVAWDDHEAKLFPASAFAGVEPVLAIDFGLSLAKARVDHPSQLVVPASADPIGRRATLLCAAQLCGIAEAARDDSVAYVSLRQQFGQPIGAFQAVKHRCSDMAARASAGWSQVLFAALAEVEALPDVDFQVTAAMLVSCDAAVRNAAANVQNHGGMGYTREVEAHHYVKNAQIFDKISGDQRHHRRVMISLPAPEYA